MLGFAGPLLTSCASIPGFANPSVRVQARLWADTARGDANSSAPAGSGAPVGGQNVPLNDLGLDDRGDDIGGLFHLGDGFSGVEFLYQGVDLFDSSPNVLPFAYGVLPAASLINSNLEMNEYRLGYIGEVFDHEFVFGEEDEEEYVNIRLGAGVEVAHRDGDFDVFEVAIPDPDLPEIIETGLTNSLSFSDGGAFYGKVRGRVSWRQFALQADFAFSPDLVLGGPVEGPLNDTEIQARYTFFEQGLTLFLGYRRSQFELQDNVQGTAFNADFVIDGFLAGAEFEF